MAELAHDTGPALKAMYRFVLRLIPKLERFPRGQRLLFGAWFEAWAVVLPLPPRGSVS